MLLSSISFEDGLDVVPSTNEEFHYEKDSQWVEHYENDNLVAIYNTRYIREMTILQISTPRVYKACDICICTDLPNPKCPAHGTLEVYS